MGRKFFARTSLSGGLLFVLVALLLSFASGAGAVQVDLYPFYQKTHGLDTQTTTGALEEGTAVWPFYHWHTRGANYDFGLLPFWSYAREESNARSIYDVIWPFYEKIVPDKEQPGGQQKRSTFAPFYYHKTQLDTQGTTITRTWVFPFYYSGERADGKRNIVFFPFFFYLRISDPNIPLSIPGPQDATALFPIAGHFGRFLFVQDFKFFLWPLYVESRQDGARNYSILWPVLGRTIGEGNSGFRVWPFVGHHKWDGHFDRWFYLWPLGYYRKTDLNTDNPKSVDMLFPFWAKFKANDYDLRYYFPVWGYLKTPNREIKAWFFPFYYHTDNYQYHFTQDNYVWIFGIKKDGENARVRRVFPFYSMTEEKGYMRKFILWPFYWERYDDQGTKERWRTFLVPFYFWEKTLFNTGRVDEDTTVWPVYFHRNENHDQEWTVLRFWWFNHNAAIERNWAPLWEFWRHTDDGRGRTTTAWMGYLYRSEEMPERHYSETNLFFYSQRHDDDQFQWSVLGGLFGRRSSPGAEAQTRWFWRSWPDMLEKHVDK